MCSNSAFPVLQLVLSHPASFAVACPVPYTITCSNFGMYRGDMEYFPSFFWPITCAASLSLHFDNRVVEHAGRITPKRTLQIHLKFHKAQVNAQLGTTSRFLTHVYGLPFTSKHRVSPCFFASQTVEACYVRHRMCVGACWYVNAFMKCHP